MDYVLNPRRAGIRITEFTLTRWLREDLPEDRATQILEAIDELICRREMNNGR